MNVEYHRDIKPILERSCVACHSGKPDKPAGNLVLDDDKLVEGPRWDLGNAGPVPATYNTLAGNYIGVTQYVCGFQSRRSLLTWKVFGRRTRRLARKKPGRRASEADAQAASSRTATSRAASCRRRSAGRRPGKVGSR